VVDTVKVSPAIIAVTPTGFAPIVYVICPGEGNDIPIGDGVAVGVLLALGVGVTTGAVEGSTYEAQAVKVAIE